MMPEALIPIVAIVCTFSIPVVAILVHHQRRMAELIHQNHVKANQPNAEVAALRQEVAQLRQLMHEQAIALDDIRSQTRALAGANPTNLLPH